MAKCKVEFIITSNKNLDALYLIGNTKELGEWNPKKALKATFDEKANAYVLNKMLTAGEVVEYKVSANQGWENVEVGMWGEELENHVFEVKKGHKEVFTIGYFKNI